MHRNDATTDQQPPRVPLGSPASPADGPRLRLRGVTRLAAAADRALVDTVLAIAEALADGACQIIEGLDLEAHVSLSAQLSGSDARTLVRTAKLLAKLPLTARLLASGDISFSQVRRFVWRATKARDQHLDDLDAAIADAAPRFAGGDPDRLVDAVHRHLDALDTRAAERREARQADGNFLNRQLSLDGGMSLYGEFDPEAAATINAALDAASAAPTAGDADPFGLQAGRPRGAQLADGLVALAEAWLAGDAAGGSARPRVVATTDIGRSTAADAAELHLGLPGPLATITGRALDRLLCDAIVTPVFTVDGVPIAVGTDAATVTDKTRCAVLARDGGCRFPGCKAPIAWCDVHHLTARNDGGTHEATNLVALCRRHHTQVHRRGWRLVLHHDGSLTVTRRGTTYTSLPRSQQRLDLTRAGPG